MKYKGLTYLNKKNDIIYPNINYILKAIETKDYFTFSKISVEWWQMFYQALIDLNINITNIEQIREKRFSEQMVKVWIEKQRKHRLEWVASSDAFEGVINFITKECPTNFILGITDRTPGTEFFKKPIYPDYKRGRHKYIIKTINSIVPNQNKILDAMCWKYWGVTGEFKEIIKISNKQNYQFILIGPSIFENFGKLCGIKNFSYIKIHDTKAALYLKEYEETIINYDKNLNGNKIYVMQGGSSTMWLCAKLHNVLQNSFIFDVGRGLDFYMNKIQKLK